MQQINPFPPRSWPTRPWKPDPKLRWEVKDFQANQTQIWSIWRVFWRVFFQENSRVFLEVVIQIHIRIWVSFFYFSGDISSQLRPLCRCPSPRLCLPASPSLNWPVLFQLARDPNCPLTKPGSPKSGSPADQNLQLEQLVTWPAGSFTQNWVPTLCLLPLLWISWAITLGH